MIGAGADVRTVASGEQDFRVWVLGRIPEDSATGGPIGPLGAYLVHHGVVPAEQDFPEFRRHT